jgi:hypothetical protein
MSKYMNFFIDCRISDDGISNSGTMSSTSSSSSAGSTDLNRQLMFRKQNNIRVKNEQNLPKHLKNLKLQQQQQQQQHFDINNNNTTTTENVEQQPPPPTQLRKPLIKIKSTTTLKNESVRVQASELPPQATSNFDPTINSAHMAVTVNPDDDDSHQRMMLVNLIHATMDAT